MEKESTRILPVQIEDEMKTSYIDYSMSVIVSRALPDVRDGLKPVHRRILVAMNDLSLYHDRPYRKSAKISGDVTGNYHPHGTTAVYDAMVRLVQEFSLRYPLVEGQGNFGSIDGDSAAAERYTEARLNQISEEMLRDLEKETVDFRPNYDETREEPTVLPSAFPNLLVNGASGIAVGMATNVPPHNLNEICDALIHLISEPEAGIDDLMRIVPGPDFPTGGIIMGRAGIRDCYITGRGLIMVRAKAEIDTGKSGRDVIIVTEIPYQVNKAAMIERIAQLVKGGQIMGISDVRDESDRRGLRVVIELRRDAQPQVVLNQLYKHTQMQITFGANLLALHNRRPVTFDLRGMLQAYLEHRVAVITRRSQFELQQARKRAHILEGFRRALDELDAVITLIRHSADVEEARNGLMSRFGLSLEQANAILEMRLQRLTGLERRKINEEYGQVTGRIAELTEILADRDRILGLIQEELRDLQKKFGDARRTTIAADAELSSFEMEDLIPEEDMVISISHAGYIKRVTPTEYRRQGRGGSGLRGASTKDEDFVEHLFVASTHSYLLLFSDRGRAYWLKVYEIPHGSRQSRGRSILNLITSRKGEKITAYVPVKEFRDDQYLVLVTNRGLIKKTRLSAFSRPRRVGIVAIDLQETDSLIGARLAEEGDDVVIATRRGKAIRFQEADVRPMGRSARGVRGVRIRGENDCVAGMIVLRPGTDELLLTVTEKGYGKRTGISEYPVHRRGAQGVYALAPSPRIGQVVSLMVVREQDEVMVMSSGGKIIRLPVREVSVLGRATQGVKLIQLGENDRVVDIAKLVKEESGGPNGAEETAADAGQKDEEVRDEDGNSNRSDRDDSRDVE